MSQGPVTIRIGGQPYRVRAQASEQELHRLAASVDARLRQLAGPTLTGNPQQALLLVAISMAHELDAQHAAFNKLQQDTAERLQLLLEEVDRALALADTALATAAHPANGSDA